MEEFRRGIPEHELQKDATKQIAYAYQQAVQLTQSAGEYERVAQESPNPQLRAEALLQEEALYGRAQHPHPHPQKHSHPVGHLSQPVAGPEDAAAPLSDRD